MALDILCHSRGALCAQSDNNFQPLDNLTQHIRSWGWRRDMAAAAGSDTLTRHPDTQAYTYTLSVGFSGSRAPVACTMSSAGTLDYNTGLRVGREACLNGIVSVGNRLNLVGQATSTIGTRLTGAAETGRQAARAPRPAPRGGGLMQLVAYGAQAVWLPDSVARPPQHDLAPADIEPPVDDSTGHVEAEGTRECVVCMDPPAKRPRLHTLDNCGHTVCGGCVYRLPGKLCPICRQRFTRSIPLYL